MLQAEDQTAAQLAKAHDLASRLQGLDDSEAERLIESHLANLEAVEAKMTRAQKKQADRLREQLARRRQQKQDALQTQHREQVCHSILLL